MLCVNPAHHYRATAISAIRHRGACWQSGTKWLHVFILKLCWAYLDLVWKSVETSVADRLMLMLFLCYSYKWHIYVSAPTCLLRIFKKTTLMCYQNNNNNKKKIRQIWFPGYLQVRETAVVRDDTLSGYTTASI